MFKFHFDWMTAQFNIQHHSSGIDKLQTSIQAPVSHQLSASSRWTWVQTHRTDCDEIASRFLDPESNSMYRSAQMWRVCIWSNEPIQKLDPSFKGSDCRSEWPVWSWASSIQGCAWSVFAGWPSRQAVCCFGFDRRWIGTQCSCFFRRSVTIP